MKFKLFPVENIYGIYSATEKKVAAQTDSLFSRTPHQQKKVASLVETGIWLPRAWT
jgi:hypothetical protein